MLIPTLALTLLLQTPAPQPPPADPAAPAQPSPEASALEVTTIDARLGPCSADFTVVDAEGMPIYNATVHVQIRYGFMSLKRMDLEVGTNGEGRARVQGLPDRARPLVYDITSGDLKTTVEQDLSKTCMTKFELTLKQS